MIRSKWLGRVGVVALLAVSGAQAVERVNDTQMYFSPSQDPITDINTGSVWVYEQYDTYGDTRLTVRCDNKGKPDFWAYLTNKNDLLSGGQLRDGSFPALTVRLGDDPAFNVPSSQLVSVADQKDRLRTRSIGFSAAPTRNIVRGLLAGKRVVIRVNRVEGGQPLTFIFPAQGFQTAWQGVRACSNTGVIPDEPARNAGPARNTGVGSLPKFTQWYFGACRDAQTGVPNTGLQAGRAQLCELFVETQGAAPQPLSADFRYELEYREGSALGKLQLDGTDHYSSSGGSKVTLRRSDNKLIFTLPLNVRKRAGRVYTSINVIGEIRFEGGSKRVYEPLPIR